MTNYDCSGLAYSINCTGGAEWAVFLFFQIFIRVLRFCPIKKLTPRLNGPFDFKKYNINMATGAPRKCWTDARI